MVTNKAWADTLSVSKDISGAYVFDSCAVGAIETQISSFLAEDEEMDARLFLEGGAELKGHSLIKLLQHSLVKQIAVEGFSIQHTSAASIYEVRLKKNNGWMTVYSNDVLRSQYAAEGILRALKNARPWYWPIYRFSGEIVAFLFWMALLSMCMVQAFEIRDPNFVWGVAGLIAWPIVSIIRRAFFREVEFKIGLAGQRAANRYWFRNFIGGSVILVIVLGLVTNVLWSQMSGP